MAYVPSSDEVSQSPPPPYRPNDTMNVRVQYQSEKPPSVESPYANLQPPPPGLIYNQSPPSVTMYPPIPMVVQHLGGFLGHNSQTIQCPSCRQQVVTQVQYEAGTATWLIAFLICFFGGVIGCCLIPFCVPSCQDAVHTCPACHNVIGRRSPF